MGKISLELLSLLADELDETAGNTKIVLEVQNGDKTTVRDVLKEVARRYPRFANSVYDAKLDKLSERVSVFLNGDSLLEAEGLNTPLRDNDILTLLPMIEGG